MFGMWAPILHLPGAAADRHNKQERISVFVAMTMCGGAWLVAAGLAKEDVAKLYA